MFLDKNVSLSCLNVFDSTEWKDEKIILFYERLELDFAILKRQTNERQ